MGLLDHISFLNPFGRGKDKICKYAIRIELNRERDNVIYECGAPVEHLCEDKKRVNFQTYSCKKHSS